MHFILFLSLLLFLTQAFSSAPTELDLLMQIKDSLDPQNQFLTSWAPKGDPCSSDSFDGVACDENGHVANISLQGRGLSGKIPPAIGGLKSLTGLYLHFNALYGEIPKEIAGLSELSDLYLNVNNLSGEIPPQIGDITSLQVLQLCYNKLSGSIPTQLGSLNRLSVLALQYNQLTGAIPASLGDLGMLTRLDLSFNSLFGSVPVKLADAPKLQVLDIRNNSLSGNVPPATDLSNPNRPEPFKTSGVPKKDIPESADLPSNCGQMHCSRPSKRSHTGIILGVIGVFIALTVGGLFTFSWYRRRKQKIGSAFDTSDGRLSTDQAKEVCRRSASPLISLEYSNGWDPLAKGQSGNGFSQEVLESFMYNLEDVERATQCFSEMNLLGKSNFSAVYKGILRDGFSCSCEVHCQDKLRGICCSQGRGECFLIYDFVPNGSLLQYLDVKQGSDKVLEWSTRISIIHGIAKGIGYLHGKRTGLVHQNLSAEKVLIDRQYKPLLSDSGLHKLLADDIVFSMLKASAAMGYLAPEYTNTGRFTEKSDIYAFGMIVFQILSGKRKISQLARFAPESTKIEEFIDKNLEGKFSEPEASKLASIALLCTHEFSSHRPSIENVIQELNGFISVS
ncbi:hypothetical protein Patl1_00256 [Pistacia atlantica]|uniref:Uncharacterized protein n=1 Tax=Pistacia atlantica TaxID=434234 RepID=A0ACC1C655_9ROSI|nr:hypothetical protein Patl1_00256 [Pistacia atlantica]